jgi:hypothetical protein
LTGDSNEAIRVFHLSELIFYIVVLSRKSSLSWSWIKLLLASGAISLRIDFHAIWIRSFDTSILLQVIKAE